jgi:pimeloyl-ACP methyl ester carboxylesterase
VTRVPYTLDELTKALAGQDAVVCAVSAGGISLQPVMVDAAEAAGVKRFVLDDFGWGPYFKGLPEFAAVKKQRAAGPERARALAEKNPGFTWSSVATGNPIDWVSLLLSLYDLPLTAIRL